MIEYASTIDEGLSGPDYRRYMVGIYFPGKVYGGLPNQKNLLESYYLSKFEPLNPNDPDDSRGTVDEVIGDLDLEQEISNSRTVFRRDNQGEFQPKCIYMAAHQVKAMIKQSASLTKFTTNKRGSKQTLAEAMTVHGIITVETGIFRTGQKLFVQPFRQEANGIEESVGHVQTARGTRSILKAAEYVEACWLQFELQILAVRVGSAKNSKDLTKNDVFEILSHGQRVGLGSGRSFDQGQFEIKQFQEITETDPIPVFDPSRHG